MSTYPIIMLPDRINRAKSSLPPTPTFNYPKPVEPGSEPQVFNLQLIAGELAGLVVVCMWLLSSDAAIGFFSFLIGSSAIAFQVFNQKKSYQKRHSLWKSAVNEYKYQSNLYESRRQQHERELKESQTPQKIANHRVEQIRIALKNTVPHDGSNNATRGRYEMVLERNLLRHFPGKIKSSLALEIPNYEYPYTVDCAYVDENLGLHIDIEVDEPYIYKSKEPYHYVGYKKDENRNDFFLENGWIVIRFAEEQVAKWPSSCCKVVALTVNELTGQDIPPGLVNESDLQPVNRWDWETAKRMADSNFRDKY